jgi:hypothetical protein
MWRSSRQLIYVQFVTPNSQRVHKIIFVSSYKNFAVQKTHAQTSDASRLCCESSHYVAAAVVVD